MQPAAQPDRRQQLPPPPEGWPSASEAAAILGEPRRTVQRWCDSGWLSARKCSGPYGPTWYLDPDKNPMLRLAGGDIDAISLAASPLAALSEAKRKAVYRRYAVVTAYLRALSRRPADVKATEFTAAWAQAFSVRHPDEGYAWKKGCRTLRRWVAAYRKGGILALADGRRSPGGAASIHPDDWDVVCGLYLSENRPAVATIYAVAAAHAAENNRALPSLRTVQVWIAERLDRKIALAGRDPKAHRDRAVPHVKRDWTKVAAMECWIGDHRQFDVWLPHQDADGPDNKWSWRRPWLTLFIDGRSWYPVGWVIEFDAPNADRVMGAFAAGIERHGRCEQLIIDNGKDFRADRFAGGRPRKHFQKTGKRIDEGRVTPLLEILGVQVHWALPYNARAKVVEPFFKLLAERFDKTFETYCGNNAQNRPEHLTRGAQGKGLKAEDYAATLTIERFREALAHFLEDQYALQKSPSAAAGGLSALRAFRELRKADFVAVRPPAEDLALLQTPSRSVCVAANGVWVTAFKQFYWSDALEDRRAASGRDRHKKVRYHYRPHDPSRIWVFDARTGTFLTIATPYAHQGLNPLVSTDADRDALAEAMSQQRRLAKRDRREVKELRRKGAAAVSRLLAARGIALEKTHRLDDVPDSPPAAARIRLTEISRAAAASGLSASGASGTSPAKKVTAADYLATGTDDPNATERADRQRPADALAVLALSSNTSHTPSPPQPHKKGSDHEQREKRQEDKPPDTA